MVIDTHGHLIVREHLSEEWWWGSAQRRKLQEAIGKVSQVEPVTAEEITERLAPREELSREEKLIPYLDEAGVDKMVLLPLDWGTKLSEPPVSIQEQNRYYADLAKKHPDRLIAFAGVDPRREKQATQLFEVGVKEWGMRGLKLHPCAGFYPNDPVVYPLYEMAQDWDLPVLVHCGPEFPPLRSNYGLPMLLDDVALDFPRLRIIIAHLGTGTAPPVSPWIDAPLWLASSHRNIYLDLGSKQIDYARSPVDFFRMLRWIMDQIPISKLLFGSDFPYIEFASPLKEWAEAFREPNPTVLKEAGVAFRREEMEAVLAKNAEVVHDL